MAAVRPRSGAAPCRPEVDLLRTPRILSVSSSSVLQDFVYSASIALMLFISSVIFAADNSGSRLETSAVVFGFLAMLAFLADLSVFVKTRGFPFKSGGKAESSNGVSAAADAAPGETDKLANGPE
ncbi:CKLF-like MARVEL transmembrane domain-containing protein 6 [Brachyistius frenatus]|uniref:CKLF-like MARVEL transmembrane domain-containing protein 6 n=1 Tax=Brachyistius frenatus TaxID=100188 RepID=UPI0037E75C57